MIVVGRKIANLTKEQEEAQSFYFDREEAEREFWQVKKLWWDQGKAGLGCNRLIKHHFPCPLQVRLIKELYGNQIEELYHSLPYHMIEFALDDSDW